MMEAARIDTVVVVGDRRCRTPHTLLSFHVPALPVRVSRNIRVPVLARESAWVKVRHSTAGGGECTAVGAGIKIEETLSI